MASDSGVIWPVIEPGDFPAMDESAWVYSFPVNDSVWRVGSLPNNSSAAICICRVSCSMA